MHLKDLKKQTPAELVTMAEELGVEGASTLRKQDLMFSILKVRAETGAEINGSGTIEVLNDGFGFLRSPEANYHARRDIDVVRAGEVIGFGRAEKAEPVIQDFYRP
jgi:transcription termination factor Rho